MGYPVNGLNSIITAVQAPIPPNMSPRNLTYIIMRQLKVPGTTVTPRHTLETTPQRINLTPQKADSKPYQQLTSIPIVGMNPEITARFRKNLKDILKEISVKRVTHEDAETILKTMVDHIKEMEEAREGFTHEWVTLKTKGRVVIPERLRTAIGATEGTRFDVHLFPNPQQPRGLAFIKE